MYVPSISFTIYASTFTTTTILTRILINWRFRFLRIYKKTRWNLHSNSYHISSHNINGKRFCAVAKKKRLKAIILTSLEMTSDFTFLFVFMSQYYCFCNVTEWHIFFFRKTNFLGIAKPKCFTIQSFSQWYGCGILQSSCSIISLQYFHWRGMFVSLYYIFQVHFFSTKIIRPYTLFTNTKFMLDETV